MKVRVNSVYRYKPCGWDRWLPTSNNTLEPGQLVEVINLNGAPIANTLGQCYVADPRTGRFICMVDTASLEEV